MEFSSMLQSIAVFLTIILLLVIILLIARKYLPPNEDINIVISEDKTLSVLQGVSIMNTLTQNGIYLPSACGGKGSCEQCKLQVTEGGGEILDSERPRFTRKEVKNDQRLGCQCKMKSDLKIKIPETVLGIGEWGCIIISSKSVSSFIKESKVQLPPDRYMDFTPGPYAQISVPACDVINCNKGFDKDDIGKECIGAWKKFSILPIKAHNPKPTVRAYSMANYPNEGDIIMLTVRIASTPFKPHPQVGFQNVPTGIASSYIFSLRPGGKVKISGPYGDFHLILNSKKEVIWVGGGAGMAPLRSQIMYMLKTLHTHDREMHYFYGAHSLNEAFFLDDFHALKEEYPNFHFRLVLGRPDPIADGAGVRYTAGFVHQAICETYLEDHGAPEGIEYYVCSPGPMSTTVRKVLDSLGAGSESIIFDNFR